MTQHSSTLQSATETALPDPECPRIYVACLAAYNNGILHGAWIDVTTPDEIRAQVQTMLESSPVTDAEEHALHDYEGFEGCHLSEYASFETVCELADYITEHGELGAEVYSCFGEDLEDARAAFEDYAGSFQSAADFAEQLLEDTGTQIPENLRYYIDYEALARDMALSGEIIIFQTGMNEVHVFWSR